ncbi:MAG: hypothetical protein WC459_00380 [Patescibacteria group bacterium]
MNNKELIQSIDQLKNQDAAGNPDGNFVAKNREILMMQIKNSSVPAEKPFTPAYFLHMAESLMPANLFKFIVRPVVLSLLVFGVAFGSWAASVSASYNSLPGDKLYSLKRMAEKAQLTLTSSNDKPSLQVELASKRLDEVAKIAEKPSISNKDERTKMAVKNFTQQVQTVKIALENLSTEQEPARVIEVAQMVDRKTAEYATVLEKTKDSTATLEIKKEVEFATSAVSDAGIKAIEVIVKKSEEGSLEINKEEVANNVGEKIKIVEQSVNQITTSTITSTVKEDVKDVLIEAKEALDSNNFGVVVDKLVEAKNLVNTVVADNQATSTPSGATASTSTPAGETNSTSTQK